MESLHHFTKVEKAPLYRKVQQALTLGGYFILTDYFAASDQEEIKFRQELACLKVEQGIDDNEFYHFDTPLTVEHELDALKEAGFSSAEVLKRWGATCIIKATR